MVEPVLQALVDRLADDAPAAVDLTDAAHEAWAVAAAEELEAALPDAADMARLDEGLVGKGLPVAVGLAVKLAASRLLLRGVPGAVHLSVVLAVYKENVRMLPADQHPHGEDFLRRKLAQLDWLFQDTAHSVMQCDKGGGCNAITPPENGPPLGPKRPFYGSKRDHPHQKVARFGLDWPGFGPRMDPIQGDGISWNDPSSPLLYRRRRTVGVPPPLRQPRSRRLRSPEPLLDRSGRDALAGVARAAGEAPAAAWGDAAGARVRGDGGRVLRVCTFRPREPFKGVLMDSIHHP